MLRGALGEGWQFSESMSYNESRGHRLIHQVRSVISTDVPVMVLLVDTSKCTKISR